MLRPALREIEETEDIDPTYLPGHRSAVRRQYKQ